MFWNVYDERVLNLGALRRGGVGREREGGREDGREKNRKQSKSIKKEKNVTSSNNWF